MKLRNKEDPEVSSSSPVSVVLWIMTQLIKRGNFLSCVHVLQESLRKKDICWHGIWTFFVPLNNLHIIFLKLCYCFIELGRGTEEHRAVVDQKEAAAPHWTQLPASMLSEGGVSLI